MAQGRWLAFVYWYSDSSNQCLEMELKCSHMVGVCIRVRHTCGFTNDGLGEHSCNGNTCSFPLMVRCGAALLYLEMFYMERSLIFKGHLIFVVSLGLVRCLPRAITNWKLWQNTALSLGVFWSFPFLPKKNNFLISGFFFLWCLWDWAGLESVVCRLQCQLFVCFS